MALSLLLNSSNEFIRMRFEIVESIAIWRYFIEAMKIWAILFCLFVIAPLIGIVIRTFDRRYRQNRDYERRLLWNFLKKFHSKPVFNLF